MRARLIIPIIAAALFIYPSCNKVNEKVQEESIDPIAFIISARVITLERGESATLTVKFIPENTTNTSLNWSSIDNRIARVSDGVITGVRAGTTEIVVESGSIMDKCSVTVVDRPGEIGMCANNLIVYEGETGKILPDAFPDDVSGVVTWTSSDSKVVSVDENGFFKAINSGTATIKAACGGVLTTCDVICYTPLSLEAIENGKITISNPLERAIIYSLNGVSNTSSSTSISIDVMAGDVVQLSGNAQSYGLGLGKHATIKCSAAFYAYGSVMSLVHAGKLSRKNELTESNTFVCLFKGCTTLHSHPTKKLLLPAMVLTSNCYDNMFGECSSMTTAPELPATVLAEHCYSDMFWDCISLTAAPDLPATNLAPKCYSWMFYHCTSLASAPSILPATELKDACYSYMFAHCAITKAPELPATTLVDHCYTGMFGACTNLSYIKALFTSKPGGNLTGDWVVNVSKTGTFVKSKDATWELSGNQGIPAGWTVEIEE